MNLALWIAQIIVAFIFLGSGIAKSVMSREKMAETGQTGAASQPLALVRFIAVCEIFGAAGLILPAALGIAPLLTPAAAIGLGIIMIGAARIHKQLKEFRSVSVNLGLLVLCLFVALGRW
jgi:uncharacterized membrane protein YphA (DoxX/SURF4 family)